jgi:hypothetical protein
MTLLLPALFACAAPVDEPGRFAGADAVQITSPSNGDRVESPFTLEWTAGANVASVELLADGRPADLVRTGTSSMVVDLGAGSWKLELVGLGARGAELSRYPITVRVADPAVESWVTITSPADGAEIPNPVTFAVDTSADVDRVERQPHRGDVGTADVRPVGDVLVPRHRLAVAGRLHDEVRHEQDQLAAAHGGRDLGPGRPPLAQHQSRQPGDLPGAKPDPRTAASGRSCRL